MTIDRKILACVDATAQAGVVTDYASWAARRLDAPIELLHVLERHVPLSGSQDHSGSIGLDAQERLMEQLTREDAERTRLAREQARALLSGLRERALQGGAATVDSRLRHGDIEETLAEQQEGARLLVTGRSGCACFPRATVVSELNRRPWHPHPPRHSNSRSPPRRCRMPPA